MVETGILREDDRVELVYGVIREMSPTNRAHALATIMIRQVFADGLTGRASVYEEKPLHLEALSSVPEPDICVCSNPDLRAYGTDSTRALLVVEVADATLTYDLTTKSKLYAEATIPEYWVVDLRHEVVHVFREPRGGAYQTRVTHQPGSRVAPISWPDFEVAVDALLPSDSADSP